MNTSETKVDVLSQYGRFAVENDGHRVTIVDEETLCVNVAVVREPKAAERAEIIVVALNQRHAVAELIEAVRQEHGGVNHHPECPICAALARIGGAA